MDEETTDRSISMAIHFLCSALEKDKKAVIKLSDIVSKRDKDEIYMFLMGLGAGMIGVSKGLSGLDKNFTKFTTTLCKNLNTDDALGV